jgi:hypothetical protein
MDYACRVSSDPHEPDVRHVWVRAHGDYGSPQPGVVISWQHAPVHNATSSAWVALVVLAPVAGTLVVEWVSTDRLIEIRDPTPADADGSG